MLAGFAIGLREGVEASLIIGIIAAFLRQHGRPGTLRLMWAGVGAAIAICIGVGIGLQALDRSLPEHQQEQLETVVAALAIVMVTGMIVWLRRHGATLAQDLRAGAAQALASGSAGALIAMAFLAVFREGFETSVFLLAALQASGDSAGTAIGAIAGIASAVVLGAAIYRSGTRIPLARFFRITGVVLVLVAAGLVSSGVHSAQEVGWITVGTSQALDLSWLVHPDTWHSSLLTGLLGFQPYPSVAEVVGWLVYAVPMLVFVLAPLPERRPEPARANA